MRQSAHGECRLPGGARERTGVRSAMDAAELVLIGINGALALGVGWRLSGALSRVAREPRPRLLYLLGLLAVYGLEAAAFAASMGTNLLSFFLAPVWGLLLGSRLRASPRGIEERIRLVRSWGVYTSLPAASFLSVPLIASLGGWQVTDPGAGFRFGVPGFLPWPANTILGFHLLVALTAAVVKVFVTTGVGATILRRSARRVT